MKSIWGLAIEAHPVASWSVFFPSGRLCTQLPLCHMIAHVFSLILTVDQELPGNSETASLIRNVASAEGRPSYELLKATCGRWHQPLVAQPVGRQQMVAGKRV